VVLSLASREALARTRTQREDRRFCSHPQDRLPLVPGLLERKTGNGMIYLAVRLAQNSVTKGSKVLRPEEEDQFWLHFTPHCDEESQIQLLDEDLEDNRVQWYRSPTIAYVLRTPRSD
jgi:hypothetical protein